MSYFVTHRKELSQNLADLILLMTQLSGRLIGKVNHVMTVSYTCNRERGSLVLYLWLGLTSLLTVTLGYVG